MRGQHCRLLCVPQRGMGWRCLFAFSLSSPTPHGSLSLSIRSWHPTSSLNACSADRAPTLSGLEVAEGFACGSGLCGAENNAIHRTASFTEKVVNRKESGRGWEALCSALHAFLAASSQESPPTGLALTDLTTTPTSSASAVALRELILLWKECYHKSFFCWERRLEKAATDHNQSNNNIDNYSPSGQNMMAEDENDSLVLDAFIPVGLPNTAALLQALCYTIRRLSWRLADGDGVDEKNGDHFAEKKKENEEENERDKHVVNRSVREMIALAQVLATHHLPVAVLTPSTWWGGLNTASTEGPTAVGLGQTRTTALAAETSHEEDWVCPRSSRLARQRERVQGLAADAPHRVVQESIVLIETVQTVLHCPEVVVSRHQSSRQLLAALYPPLLSVLGLSEQLDSCTLAALATCIAQCAESHSIEEHIRLSAFREQEMLDDDVGQTNKQKKDENRTRQNKSEMDAVARSTMMNTGLTRDHAHEEPALALRAMLRRYYQPSLQQPSLQAMEEAAALQRWCPEGPPRFRTTTTLSHLHVLARVCQQRMENALCEYICTRILEDETGQVIGMVSPEDATAAGTPIQENEEEFAEDWRDSAEREETALKAFHAFQGMLSLLSLGDRKRLLEEPFTGCGGHDIPFAATSPSQQVFVTLYRRQAAALAAAAAGCTRQTGSRNAGKGRQRRKTIADYEQEAASAMALADGPGDPSSSSASTAAAMQEMSCKGEAPAWSDGLTRHCITLSDAAEVADAVASMQYRDTAFWSTLARFTRWQMWTAVTCFRSAGTRKRRASDRDNDGKPRPTPRCRSASLGMPMEDVSQTMGEAELEGCISEARRICFALDFVQQNQAYKEVMDELVRLGILQHPLPPPSSLSAGAAMRHVGSASADHLS